MIEKYVQKSIVCCAAFGFFLTYSFADSRKALNDQIVSTVADTRITPCHSVCDLESYVTTLTPYDLVVFDFDNTLFRPASPDRVGGDEWVRSGVAYFIKQLKIEYKDAFKIIYPSYSKINETVDIKPVEDERTLKFLKKVQASGCRILILTARTIIDQTFKQIKNIDFDFTKNAPWQDDIHFSLVSEKKFCDYKKGFLFCGSNNKGEALFAFLQQIKHVPQSIFFMDDRKENVEGVQQACSARNTPFKGIHYVYLEEEIKDYKFDPQTLVASA
ncbi:MAG: DUF2608 domain-containing protein [Candidatus Babeliales bacterium]